METGRGLARGDLDDLAGGEEAVVDAVVALGEEHVAADLAAEQDLVVAHLALEVRVPGLPHDGHAAVARDVVDERLRATSRRRRSWRPGAGASRSRARRARIRSASCRRPRSSMTPTRSASPSYAMPRSAPSSRTFACRSTTFAGVLGIGQVVGEAPVRLAVQLDDLAADAAQELGRVEARHAVAGVDHHLEPAAELDEPGDGRRSSRRAGSASSRRAGAALEVAALDRGAQPLDLVLGERGGAGMDHLHAVVLDGIVAAGDVGAAVERPVRGGEVEDRRGDEADVDDVDAGGAHALDEARLELGDELGGCPGPRRCDVRRCAG